jgi:hypothetical protein
MTVCIAAVCEEGGKIVVAADRMLTFPYPMNIEFETEEQKIEQLASSCVALVSGSTAYATEILGRTRKGLNGSPSPEIEKVIESVLCEYTSVRMEKIDETIIAATLGGDYARFIERGGTLPNYLQLQAQIYQQLSMLAQQFNLSTDIMVAGIDSLGAHVSVATHPGTTMPLDKLGYGAIGSGGIHATIHLSLIGQTRRKGFFETLYNVYAAKIASQSAPGVGEATDIAVVEVGRVFFCTEPILEAIHGLYVASTTKVPLQYDSLEGVYNEQHGD